MKIIGKFAAIGPSGLGKCLFLRNILLQSSTNLLSSRTYSENSNDVTEEIEKNTKKYKTVKVYDQNQPLLLVPLNFFDDIFKLQIDHSSIIKAAKALQNQTKNSTTEIIHLAAIIPSDSFNKIDSNNFFDDQINNKQLKPTHSKSIIKAFITSKSGKPISFELNACVRKQLESLPISEFSLEYTIDFLDFKELMKKSKINLSSDIVPLKFNADIQGLIKLKNKELYILNKMDPLKFNKLVSSLAASICHSAIENEIALKSIEVKEKDQLDTVEYNLKFLTGSIKVESITDLNQSINIDTNTNKASLTDVPLKLNDETNKIMPLAFKEKNTLINWSKPDAVRDETKLLSVSNMILQKKKSKDNLLSIVPVEGKPKKSELSSITHSESKVIAGTDNNKSFSSSISGTGDKYISSGQTKCSNDNKNTPCVSSSGKIKGTQKDVSPCAYTKASTIKSTSSDGKNPCAPSKSGDETKKFLWAQMSPCGSSKEDKSPCDSSMEKKNPCGGSKLKKSLCGDSGQNKNPCVTSKDIQSPCGASKEKESPCNLSKEKPNPCDASKDKQSPCGASKDKPSLCGNSKEKQSPCSISKNSELKNPCSNCKSESSSSNSSPCQKNQDKSSPCSPKKKNYNEKLPCNAGPCRERPSNKKSPCTTNKLPCDKGTEN